MASPARLKIISGNRPNPISANRQINRAISAERGQGKGSVDGFFSFQ